MNPAEIETIIDALDADLNHDRFITQANLDAAKHRIAPNAIIDLAHLVQQCDIIDDTKRRGEILGTLVGAATYLLQARTEIIVDRDHIKMLVWNTQIHTLMFGLAGSPITDCADKLASLIHMIVEFAEHAKSCEGNHSDEEVGSIFMPVIMVSLLWRYNTGCSTTSAPEFDMTELD